MDCLSQQVLKAGIRRITGDALWETSFPKLVDTYKPYRKVLQVCANECGYGELADRFTQDGKFGIIMARIVSSSFWIVIS